jgi:hypothetical protein
MEGIRHWLTDPQASATLVIALVAGVWAITQFRPVARERRRETYNAMTTHYSDLRAARDRVVPRFPPLLAIAQDCILESAAEALGLAEAEDANRDHLIRLIADMHGWTRFGLSFTAAGEVVASEAKFRSVLWAVESIKQWRIDSVFSVRGREYSAEVLEDAEGLAHDLNAFLFHYETGSYPARQTLGLLHRSLAIVSKALEPVVWERSLQARWGRRVVRIGVAAQHFNDVTTLHCISDLTWGSSDGNYLIHPRLKHLVVGAAVLASDSPVRPRILPALRLGCRAGYWYLMGIVSPKPRLWFLSYGGWRLRCHRRNENQLAGLLNVALSDGFFSDDERRPSLDFSWNLAELKREQREVVRRHRREQGWLSWLWLPRP